MTEENFSAGTDAPHRQTRRPADQQRAEYILNTIQEACFELNRSGTLVFVNRKTEELFGQKKENLVGRNIWDVFPEPATSPCFEAINMALAHQLSLQNEYVSAVLHRWISLSATPTPDGMIVLFHEIEDIKGARQKLREEHYRLNEAQAIGHIGSFERNFPEEKVHWSDELYRIHGLDPKSEMMTSEKFLSFAHPEDLPELQKAITHTWDTGYPMDIVQRIILRDGTIRHVHRRARVGHDEQGNLVKITGTIQDITGQVTANESLQKQEQQFKILVETIPDVVNRWDRNLKLLYANSAYETRTGYPNAALLGKDNLEMGFPDEIALPWMEKLQQVFETGMAANYYTHLHTPTGPMDFYAQIVPEFDREGKVATVLSVARDITELRKAEQEINEKNDLLQSVFDASSNSISVFKSVRNRKGEITDFEWLLADKLTELYAGGIDVKGKRFGEIFPGVITTGTLQKCIQVVEETGLADFEQLYDADGLHSWFRNVLVKIGDGLIITSEDITDRKKAEIALQQSKDLLETIFNTSPFSLVVAKSLRNKKGRIIDFEFTWTNAVAEKIGGGNLVGTTMLAQFPQVKNIGLFQLLAQAVETRKVVDFDYNYIDGRLSGWYRWIAAKLGDGIFFMLEDVEERRLQEIEIRKNLAILQQAEELAGMGSWEYQPADQTFRWSEGMYRLFGLPPGLAVIPGLHLDFAVAKDQPIARRIVKHIVNGHESFAETLRIQVKGVIKTLKIKATAILQQDGQPARMIGVALDVSEVQRLEKENVEIKLNQQKAMLLAILEAQEEERKRIAESLHNGLAQLLYATRLHLDQIKFPVKDRKPGDLRKIKDQTDRLLVEAIHQTRQISHELIPKELEDFGLGVAVREIGKRFHSQDISFHCRVSKLKTPLDNYLQLAIYRICQELANNIVKHAGARQASIQIRQAGNTIAILAEDNGRGFNPKQQNLKGMGLKAIRDRVKLLSGTLEIDSNPQQGTLISIYLPLPNADVHPT